ncbi:hypothetical protein ACJX0J_008860 [Zea mays]
MFSLFIHVLSFFICVFVGIWACLLPPGMFSLHLRSIKYILIIILEKAAKIYSEICVEEVSLLLHCCIINTRLDEYMKRIVQAIDSLDILLALLAMDIERGWEKLAIMGKLICEILL